jgi:serine/threonine-protein kinase
VNGVDSTRRRGDRPASDPPSSARLGRTLGQWELEDLLGEGGAGAVYAATSRTNGQRAAVKVLHPELAADDGVRTRFVREAYVANRIDHPGVVRVLEDGVDQDGSPYIVMELLEGETFEARALRKGGKLPVTEVLWVADKTLQCLSVAHDKGVVHRDIKPENLFLTQDRDLKVLDFGIARLGDASGHVTKMGTVLGTLAYMPPEQARGATTEVGVQSDLWSVGATMFTLLSGRLVREDEDVQKLLREAGRTKVPSLGDVAPELPDELVKLVDYALSLEIEVRWPTARMMRRAIRMVYAKLRHREEEARRPPPADGDDNDDWVSEPSFDFVAANRAIEPPPMSVARPERQTAEPPPPAPSLAVPVSRPATTTLSSARRSDPAPPAPAPVAATLAPKRGQDGARARSVTWALIAVVVLLLAVIIALVATR